MFFSRRRPARLRFAPLLAWPLVVAGCSQPNTYQPPPPPEVTVARPVFKKIRPTLEYTGTTAPVATVEIRARVKGFLESIEFTEGGDVQRGDLLYRIDPAPFETTLRQAESAVELAKANVKNAEAEYLKAKSEAANADAQLARGERAAQGGAVTQGELDDLRTTRQAAYASAAGAQAAVGSAKAQVKTAEAQVAQAKLDLGYTEVRSPISGRVGETLVDVGNLVGASEPTHLTTVISYDPIHAYYTISEADVLMWLGWIREGKGYTPPGREATRDFPLFLGLANEEGFPHEGVFDFPDLAVDQSTGTLRLRGRWPNPDRQIPLGAFVRVQVPLIEEEALLIDERAIGRGPQGSYVLVVVDKEGQQVVERRGLDLGESFEGQRIVRSKNLTVDDRVVINGLQRARPGAVVRAVEAAAPGSAAAGPPADPDSAAAPRTGPAA